MPSQFFPGFRLSTTDILVLVIASVTSVVLGISQNWLGWLIAFVVCHFFLFCNVFRISRPLELLWAGVFLILAICTARFAIPGWQITLFLSMSLTVILVAIEMRKPSHHGVWWQYINPELPEWWGRNAGSEQ